jgi:hypothetical protein
MIKGQMLTQNINLQVKLQLDRPFFATGSSAAGGVASFEICSGDKRIRIFWITHMFFK